MQYFYRKYADGIWRYNAWNYDQWLFQAKRDNDTVALAIAEKLLALELNEKENKE